ncbi:MAG: VWA domain-containing protein [Deltaproteobacteria bacterium]|nr:VWA domain-containing protein [Deltaproteobacteria bacterium]
MLVLLDRSRSMVQPAVSVDRFTPAVAAIRALVTPLEQRVKFGLALFPSPDVTGAESICATAKLAVRPWTGTATAISSALEGVPAELVGGSTPTAEALRAAAEMLVDYSGSRYVLLVTDGAPNCDATLDAATCTCTSPRQGDCSGAPLVDGGVPGRVTPELCLDDAGAVAAVQALAAQGIGTFVVGYDATGFEPVLDAMAAAGGTARRTYFPVSDGASLDLAFREASAFVVSCTFELTEAPESVRYVSVAVDGTRLRPEQDYVLSAPTTVALTRDACAKVSDGLPHDIVVVRECAPVVE